MFFWLIPAEWKLSANYPTAQYLMYQSTMGGVVNGLNQALLKHGGWSSSTPLPCHCSWISWIKSLWWRLLEISIYRRPLPHLCHAVDAPTIFTIVVNSCAAVLYIVIAIVWWVRSVQLNIMVAKMRDAILMEANRAAQRAIMSNVPVIVCTQPQAQPQICMQQLTRPPAASRADLSSLSTPEWIWAWRVKTNKISCWDLLHTMLQFVGHLGETCMVKVFSNQRELVLIQEIGWCYTHLAQCMCFLTKHAYCHVSVIHE